MTMRVALDTSLLVGLVDRRDTWHVQAKELRTALDELGAVIILLDPVINEVVSVVARRFEEQHRLTQFSSVLTAFMQSTPPDAITWISGETQRLYPDILTLVGQHEGRLNFHDALIALACREIEVEHIASFDRDFDHVQWLTRISRPEHLRQLDQPGDPVE